MSYETTIYINVSVNLKLETFLKKSIVSKLTVRAVSLRVIWGRSVTRKEIPEKSFAGKKLFCYLFLVKKKSLVKFTCEM